MFDSIDYYSGFLKGYDLIFYGLDYLNNRLDFK